MNMNHIFSRKTVYILSAVIIIYSLVGFFLLPVIGKNIIKDKLSKFLNRTVTIEKISVNPFALTAEIDALSVKKKKIFFSAQKFFVNLSIASLFTLTPVVSDISVEKPYLNIVRNKDGSFNFSDLLSSGEKSKKISAKAIPLDKENQSSGKLADFILENIAITRGEIRFADNACNVSHLVKDISVSIPFLSSKAKYRHEKSKLNMDFILNQAKFNIHAQSTPFAEDLSSNADIKTVNIDLTHYLSYIPIPENILVKSLKINCDIHADFHRKKSENSLLIKGKFNALNADIKGIDQEEIIKFPALSLDISKSDILAGKLNISKLFIKDPEVNLSRDKKGKLSLLQYMPQNKENLQSAEDKNNVKALNPPFLLNLKDFIVSDGAVLFHDSATKKPFKTKIYPLNIQIENLKAIAGKEVSEVSGDYNIKLTSEAQENLALDGHFQTSPVQLAGNLKLSNLIINKYAPYYGNLTAFDVAKGRVNFSTGFKISRDHGKVDAVFKTGEFLVQSLSVFDPKAGEEVINIPEFKIKGSIIDLGKKKISTGEIITQNGRILLKRLKDGEMNIVKAALPKPVISKDAFSKSVLSGPVVSKAVLSVDTAPNREDVIPADHQTKKENKPSGAKTSSWDVTMNSFNANGFNVMFKDLTNQDPVSVDLSNILIKADNLENYGRKNGHIAVNMNFNDTGRISIKGSAIPSLLRAGLDINLDKIDIKPLQPYFTDFIRVLVTDGNIEAKGNLKLDLNNKSNIDFKGQASVNNFICLDKQSAKDFFKCNSLYLAGLEASVSPVKIRIKDISLTDFYSRIIISNKGEINLNQIFKKNTANNKSKESIKGSETAAVSKDRGKEKPDLDTRDIQINNITVQGGNINFSDYSTQPNFTADMKKIAGSLTNLSSLEQSRAILHLQGLHGQSSPLEIVGKINPLARHKFADINLSFKDIELAKFTPYSSKYLGYKIEKGKLDLDLKYLINANKLTSENKIKFNNLTLGEKVKSDKATSLPVSLAISLLKNKQGQIDLDLPVTGELNDPEFKISSIVFTMISNLIIKVVTSPFSIIASMFGGGEDIAFVDFKYGETKINALNYKKIDTLAEILRDKPSVKLEIQGFYDKVKDYEALKMKKFYNLLKAEKLKKMLASGSDVKTLKQIKLDQQDMEPLIDAAYARAEFPKPRDDAGHEKQVNMEEKKKLLITNIHIGKDDLDLLAMKRSEDIKAYLILKGKVEKQRIFLLEPKADDNLKKENTSRVRFSLK